MLNIHAILQTPVGNNGVICSIRQDKVEVDGLGIVDRWIIRVQNNASAHWFELSFDPLQFMEWCDSLMATCIQNKVDKFLDGQDNVLPFNPFGVKPS